MASRKSRKSATPVRRDEIVDAALRIISREGFEGATVRAIAREAGCTTGAPTHHFNEKDELLAAVFARLVDVLQSGPMGRPPGPDPLKDLRDVLFEGLPRDEERRQAWKIWFHCVAQALSRPHFAAEHRKRAAAIRASLSSIIRRAQFAGQIREDADPDAEADRLACVIDGIAVRSLLDPKRFPTSLQERWIEEQLAPILTQPTRAHPGPEATGLESRLERVESRLAEIADLEAIRSLRYRYHECINEGRFDEVADLFVEDGVGSFGYLGTATGAEELSTFFRGIPTWLPFVKQFIHNHVVSLNGDEATGYSYFEARTISKGESYMVAARFDDEYARRNGRWKFRSVRLTPYFTVPLREGWANEDRLKMQR